MKGEQNRIRWRTIIKQTIIQRLIEEETKTNKNKGAWENKNSKPGIHNKPVKKNTRDVYALAPHPFLSVSNGFDNILL